MGTQPSVTRRVLAIMFGVAGAGVMTYLAINGSEPAFTALVGIVGMVIGYYFGVANKS